MRKHLQRLFAVAALMAMPAVATAQTGTTLTNSDLPRTFTFEEGSGDDAYLNYANGSDGWFIGGATFNGGSQSLYVSNDNGTTNAYSTANVYSYAWITIDVQESGEYEISFDWKGTGESSYDYMYVYWAPASVTPTAGSSLSGATQIGSRFNQQTSWQNFYGTQVITDAELGEYKLVFMWRSDGSVFNNPPAAIDNLYVGKLTCPAPTALSFSQYTNNGATATWSPVGDETEWIVYIDGVATADSPVSDTAYTFSGLDANTEYNVWVRALCGEGDTSMQLSGSFRTLCQEGNCNVTLQVSQYSYAGSVNVIQNGASIDNVSFSYSSGTSRTVEICNGDSLIMVYTAPTYSYSTATWTVLDAGDSPLATFTNGTSNGDTVLAVANGCPSCMPVSVLTQTPADAFSTTIHWTDNNVAGLGDYVVIINGVEYPVSGDSTYALSTWPLTHYDVSVARICEGNDTSAFRSISFNAPCDESVYAEVPFSSGFEELNTNESPDCWVQVEIGGNPGIGAVFPSAYRWAPNAHTGSVYFEFESSTGTETEVLALPRMEDVSTLQLSFYAATTVTRNYFILEAGVIETDDEGNMVFVPVDTVDLYAGPNEAWHDSYRIYNILFDTYEGDGDRLAIRTTPTTGSMYTLMIDDFNVIRVGVPVLGPFDHSSYTINMGDTLHLNANLMTGDVDTWTWSSDMIDNGDAVVVEQDSSAVTIVYNAAGTDILTVTAANAIGSATKSVTVNVIDNSLISEYPYTTGFEPGDDRSWYTDGDLNGWYIGTATATEEGGTSLYISRDNGATNVMADGLTCRSYAYRHFDMLNGGEFELSFWWKGNGTSGSRYMEVYIASGAVNPTHGSYPSSSWTRIATCTNASVWTEFNDVFEAEADTNTLIFYWYGTGNANPPHAVDDITINKLNCSRVGNLEAHNVFAHSADIVWTPRSDETEWWVVVDTNEGYSVAEDSLHLDGFDGQSSHTVQVRAICGDGDTSAVRTVSFTTTVSCPAVSNIQFEDVTGSTATISWTPGGEETSWKLVIGDGDTVDVTEEPTYSATGLEAMTNYTVTVIADCGDVDGVSTATTATFHTLCDGGTCEMELALMDSYGDGWNNGALRVVQNGVEMGSATIPSGGSSATVLVPVCSVMPASIIFVAGSFPAEMGATIYTGSGVEVFSFADHTMSSSNNGDTLVTVAAPCAGCARPDSLHVSNIEATSLTFEWAAVDTVAGYLYSLNGSDWTLVTGGTYTATGLDANTNYTFELRTLCGDDDTSNARSVSARTLCAGGNCEFTVEMADSWGDGWNGNAAINVYQNGDQIESLTVASGSSNTVTVSTCLGDSVYLFWKSGTFDSEASFVVKDAADSILLTSGAMNGHSTGDTIMYFDGLCEATVVMSTGGTQSGCQAPTNLTATATESSISITFNGTASSYEVGIVEGSTWNEYDAETDEIYNTSYTFGELTEGTTYTVAVRSVCGDDWDIEYSNWVTTTITTEDVVLPCACDVPTNLHLVSRDTTHAVIDWTPGENNISWDVELDGNVINVTNHPYAISGLTPGNTYTVRVRAHCCEDMQEASDWTSAITFTTDNSGSHEGIAAADGIECTLSPNPATSIVNIEVAEDAVVSLVDLNGRVSGEWRAENGKLTVDVSGMAKGAYFVRIVTEKGTAVRKLIVR